MSINQPDSHTSVGNGSVLGPNRTEPIGSVCNFLKIHRFRFGSVFDFFGSVRFGLNTCKPKIENSAFMIQKILFGILSKRTKERLRISVIVSGVFSHATKIVFTIFCGI